MKKRGLKEMINEEIDSMGEHEVNCWTCKFHGDYCRKGYTEDECGSENGYPFWVDYMLEDDE